MVAPLDWGLGHTTRCVPIIRWLQRQGHVVVVAGNEAQLSFIDKIFSGIERIHLEGYNIRYAQNDRMGKAVLLGQVPAICISIKKEHLWLEQNIKTIAPDFIISDNRYGLYFKGIPSIILTHQLMVQTGMGNLANQLTQKLHYNFLKHFDEVWVPDVETSPNLGGALAHCDKLPPTTKYIGLLSQFEGLPDSNTVGSKLLIMLSGPEPQRTILADILWQQCLALQRQVIFVAGSSSAAAPTHIPAHIRYYTRSGGSELAGFIAEAEIVVCRSGYSSLMDLVLLGKKAILIPTPGQTEQAYLARHLEQEGIFLGAEQSNFNLSVALKKAEDFLFRPSQLQAHFRDFERELDRWMKTKTL